MMPHESVTQEMVMGDENTFHNCNHCLSRLEKNRVEGSVKCNRETTSE